METQFHTWHISWEFVLLLPSTIPREREGERARAEQREADAQWKMSRVKKTKSYLRQYPVPPPFNVPCLLLRAVLSRAWWLRAALRKQLGGAGKDGAAQQNQRRRGADAQPRAEPPARAAAG